MEILLHCKAADGLLSLKYFSWRDFGGGWSIYVVYCVFLKLHYAGHFHRERKQAQSIANLTYDTSRNTDFPAKQHQSSFLCQTLFTAVIENLENYLVFCTKIKCKVKEVAGPFEWVLN